MSEPVTASSSAAEESSTPPVDYLPDDREGRIQAVREPCLRCTACDLSATRTQVVFGEGNVRSPLVIVGEGPGEQEDATGRPFVGRSGALLDAVLRENGILRKQIWITNVLKCRACLVESRRVQNRPPRVDEVEACRPWLQSELGVVSPLVILCLGGPAASWIIHPDFKVLRERGRWFPTSWATVAMATLHPAFVLRQNGPEYDAARSTLVNDIGQARLKVLEIRRAAKEAASPPPVFRASDNGEQARPTPAQTEAPGSTTEQGVLPL